MYIIIPINVNILLSFYEEGKDYERSFLGRAVSLYGKKLYHSLEKATAPNTVWNIYTDKL